LSKWLVQDETTPTQHVENTSFATNITSLFIYVFF
jgi:hypothetical protein